MRVWLGLVGALVVLAAEGTSHADYRGQRLIAGGTKVLYGNSNDYIMSQDGHNMLIMQSDCNLVLYNDDDRANGRGATWASNTWQQSTNCYAYMDATGNFGVYGGNYEILWETNTGCVDLLNQGYCPSDVFVVVQSIVKGVTIEETPVGGGTPQAVWASSGAVQSWANGDPYDAYYGVNPVNSCTTTATETFCSVSSGLSFSLLPDNTPPSAGCRFDRTETHCAGALLFCADDWVCGWNYGSLSPKTAQGAFSPCGLCIGFW
jgi:hypothetical protein